MNATEKKDKSGMCPLRTGSVSGPFYFQFSLVEIALALFIFTQRSLQNEIQIKKKEILLREIIYFRSGQILANQVINNKYLCANTRSYTLKKLKYMKKDQAGFTMVELISVLVIIAILTAVAAPKFIQMSFAVEKKAVNAGIAEFNSREQQLWNLYFIQQDAEVLASDKSLNNMIYASMDGYLDPDKVGGDSSGAAQEGDDWTYTHTGPYPPNNNPVNGLLRFKDVTANIIREPATLEHPAKWKISSFVD